MQGSLMRVPAVPRVLPFGPGADNSIVARPFSLQQRHGPKWTEELGEM